MVVRNLMFSREMNGQVAMWMEGMRWLLMWLMMWIVEGWRESGDDQEGWGKGKA